MGDARKKRDSINLFRGAAALLLAASLLCTLAGQTLAASEPVSSPVSDNRPAVVIEGNAVVDSNGQPTGFFELSMKVRTKFYLDAEGKLVDSTSAVETLDHPFRSAAVALRYDAELLTPVSWSYTPEDYAADVPGLDVSGANALKPAYLETKKPDSGVSATAKVESYTASDANNSGRPTAQLVLSAEAGGTAVSYEQETAVCVVRFKYDLDRVTMRAGDNYAFLRPAATPTGADGKKFCVVWFAEDAVAAKSSAGQSVWYQGTKSMAETAQADRTYFYYYLDAPAMTAAGAPKTDGGTIFTGSPVKDYTSNLLSLQETGDPAMPGKVQFKLVNMPSYASGGVNMANMATILFYDWDDALLGVLTVEKGDARAAVNAYVEEKMIYPDLWASKHAGDAAYMESLDRAYTYRGTYPAEGPSGSTTVTDGGKYALTNKLDYAFYRRPTELVEPAPTDPEGTAAYWEVASNASSEEAYPYVNGWAVVADIKDIENVWTTFGAGELKDVNPAAASGRYTTAGTAANYFKLEDFSNLTPGIHYVKACYEPGRSLDLVNNYTVLTTPRYLRYGTTASTESGSSYAIGYQYGRINNGYGVKRTRDPSVSLAYTLDMDGISGDSFNIEVTVENLDFIDVTFTPSSKLLSLNYQLVERYGASNFVVGQARSTLGNEANILNNFKYLGTSNDGYPYDQRLGTDGFVFRATMQQILAEGLAASRENNKNILSPYLSAKSIQDLNLRLDSMGTEVKTAADALDCQDMIFDALKKAYDANLVNAGAIQLDWHQLQYHIINYSSGGILQDGRILTPAECGGFAWCRLDECGGNGPTIVVTFQDLLTAGYKAYVEGAVSPAMDSLTLDKVNSFYLRKDAAGSEFATVDDFKAAFSGAMQKLATGGYVVSTISTVDWIELQHTLLPNTTYQTAANLRANPAIDYWWEAGKTPGIAVLSALLKAAYRVYVDGGSSADLSSLTMATVDGFYLRADIGGHKFTGMSDFENTLKIAMQKLKTGGFYSAATIGTATWEELQYVLIHGAYQLPPITEDYWWKNGNTPDINTFADLAAIGYRVYVDGNAPSMLDKLFAMNSVTNAPMWLRANTDGDAFPSVAKVKETLEMAVKQFQAAGKTAADMASLTWLEFQHVMLGNPYRSDVDLQSDQTAGIINYWWYNGGVRPLKTFPALLEAADKAAGGDTSLLDALTMDVLNSAPIGLRADFKGTPYTDLSAFRAQITAMAAAAVAAGKTVMNLTWNEVQYYLVHGVLEMVGGMADSEGNAYYWWYNGGAGTAVVLTATSMTTWLDAAYRAQINGNTHAWDNLTASLIESARFVKIDDNSNTFADLPKFAVSDLTVFGAAMGKLVEDAISAAANYKTLTWYQAQYYLLTGTYAADSPAMKDDYWWKEKDTDPSTAGVDPLYTEFLDQMSIYAHSNSATDLNWFTLARVNELSFKRLDSGAAFTAAQLTQIKNRLKGVIANAMLEPAYWDGTKLNLTWYQVQYALISTAGDLVDPETARAKDYEFAPAWAKAAYPMAMGILDMIETLSEKQEIPEQPAQTEPSVAPEQPEQPEQPEETEFPAQPQPTVPEFPEEQETPAVSEEPEEPEFPPMTEEKPQLTLLEVPLTGEISETGALADEESLDFIYRRNNPAVENLAFMFLYEPATLPLPSPRITQYRWTLRLKKVFAPANQGGINV